MINKISLNFWGRTSRGSKTIVNLQLRITVNGEREEIGALNIKLPKSDWIQRTQKVRGTNPSALQLNLRLNTIKSDILSIYNHFEVNKTIATAAQIKALYRGEVKARLNFTELFNEYSQSKKGLSKLTLKGYKRRYSKLFEFVNKKIMPDEVDVKVINRLGHEMKKRNYSDAYIYKCKAAIKMLIDFGNDCGLISGQSIGGIERKNKIDITHLSIFELELLRGLEIATIQKDIDVFLIGCYTGMAFSDIMRFTADNIVIINDREFIRGKRLKTGSGFFLPLFSEAKNILEKYNYIIPKLYNNKCNKNIKIALDVIGVKKYIKFHYSRKTFANYCLNHLLLSKDTTAKMMGQKDTKELDVYADVTIYRVIEETKVAA